ncbi:MAG: class I SAM-dependent methyltransferase [Saprospiraceae bacterium]|nr:class I SAM-dependent methyltransferase [Saprospiraceae bacterium]
MGIKKFLARQASHPKGWFGRNITARLFGVTNSKLEDWGFDLMDPDNSTDFLEIGFGNGRLLEKMGTTIEKGHLAGIDISRDMVRVARQKNRGLIDKGRLELQVASVSDIPFPDSSFDLVWTANTIYFWKNPPSDLEEVLRVLRSGGRFFCAIRSHEEMMKMPPVTSSPEVFRNTYTKDEIGDLLENSGFSNVNVLRSDQSHFEDLIAIGEKL